MATHFALLFGLLVAPLAQAAEPSTLVRVTTYCREEGQPHAASNGARLRNGHCAVDPKKIPYGSKIILGSEELIAVDTGPAVVSRKAARGSGRNRAEREAMVVDRYFETRSQALAWEKSHPHFMKVQIVTPGKMKSVANNSPPPPVAAAPRVSMAVALQPAFPTGDSYFGAFSESSPSTIRSNRRRTGADWSFAGVTKSRGPLEALRLSWLQID
ncbi:MAG: hypothetical protein DMF40_13140 [Verrucomicrobia bacterium]|nr:MAG: hypothetical protein DMF40_13140 [Verrucomicrobiota bacterium]